MNRLLLRSGRLQGLSRLSTAASAAPSGFLELLAVSSTPAERQRRLLTHLKLWNAAKDRPLALRPNSELLQAPERVARLSPLVQWIYRQLHAPEPQKEAGAEQIEQLVDALQPWTNMVRDQVWRQFYLRQFLLVRAPLSAYLAVFARHRAAVSQSRSVVLEDGSTSTVPRKNPLPAALLVKELLWRGRFEEAVEAYKELPLRQADRAQIAAMLHEQEQFEALLALHAAHRAVHPKLPPLDKYPQLHALSKLGRREEMDRVVQNLSAKEQSRPDIQALLK